MFTFDLKVLKGMHLGRNLYLKERIELSCGVPVHVFCDCCPFCA